MNSLPEILLISFAVYGVVSCFFDFINFIKLPAKKVKEISKLIISSESDSDSDSKVYQRKRRRVLFKLT